MINLQGIRGIKPRLANMTLPLPGQLSSVSSIDGYIYGAHYSATVRNSGPEGLGLIWSVSISGTEEAISLVLKDFVRELGESIRDIEMPSVTEGVVLKIYFWSAEPTLH